MEYRKEDGLCVFHPLHLYHSKFIHPRVLGFFASSFPVSPTVQRRSSLLSLARSGRTSDCDVDHEGRARRGGTRGRRRRRRRWELAELSRSRVMEAVNATGGGGQAARQAALRSVRFCLLLPSRVPPLPSLLPLHLPPAAAVCYPVRPPLRLSPPPAPPLFCADTVHTHSFQDDYLRFGEIPNLDEKIAQPR